MAPGIGICFANNFDSIKDAIRCRLKRISVQGSKIRPIVKGRGIQRFSLITLLPLDTRLPLLDCLIGFSKRKTQTTKCLPNDT